ncbi:Protein bric-a-brac 2, partial [Armadillidium nasatum]
MDGKRYALRWRHHQSTVVAEVGSLYRDSALVDVTLACEDQRTYQAHKLVLSACSQYFQSLFSRHPAHQHPIIFLKDVRGDECEALLTYMYKGEVSVNQDQIPRILRVASSLQVRGLAEVDPQNSRPSSPTYGDRGTHCGSSSPSPSTGPPTKCATPSSEPQSPNGNAASTPQLGTHSGGHHTDSISTSRHPSSLSSSSLPHHPSHSLSQDFSPYHLLPHPRPPYDPSSILGPLTDPDRKRLDEKPPPHSLVGPYPPPL